MKAFAFLTGIAVFIFGVSFASSHLIFLLGTQLTQETYPDDAAGRC